MAAVAPAKAEVVAAVAPASAASKRGREGKDEDGQQQNSKPPGKPAAKCITEELHAMTASVLWGTSLSLRDVNQRLCRATSLAQTLQDEEKFRLEEHIDMATTLSSIFRKVRNSGQTAIDPQQEFDVHACQAFGRLEMAVLRPFMAAVVKKTPEDMHPPIGSWFCLLPFAC